MKKVIKVLLFVVASFDSVSSPTSLVTHKGFGKTHFIVGYKKSSHDHIIQKSNPPVVTRNTSYTLDNDKITQAFFTSSHDIRNVLSSLICQAQTSILVAAFALTDNAIAQQLKKAHKEGITVEIITDVANMQERYSKINFLCKEKIPVYYYNPDLNANPRQKGSRYARMHHKFLVIDGKVAVNGSTNLTKSGQKDNIENIVVLRDQDTIKDFIAEFDHLKTMCACKTHE